MIAVSVSSSCLSLPGCFRTGGSARASIRAALLLCLFSLSATGLLAQAATAQYVVRLRSEAVLNHAEFRGGGRRAALLRQMESGEAAPDLKNFVATIRAEQSALQSHLRGFNGAAVLYQTELVMNAAMVELSDADVERLRQLPEVAEIYPAVTYHKTMDAALQLIGAEGAWNLRTGGEAGAGQGVKIGVIDTGLDITSPMLQDPSLVPPAGFPKFTQAIFPNCVVDDHAFTNSKVIVARNYVSLLPTRDPNCDAMDRDGHGTFSASVAAGRRVAAPLASIAGVAPRAYLGNYKVFGTPGSNDSASLSSVLAALDDAVRDGMDVINMSLGADLNLPPATDPLALAVRTAVNAGVVVVAAAGNEGPGSDSISSPGVAPEAITVGASTNSRAFALPLEISAAVPVPAGLQRIPSTVGAGVSLTVPIGPAFLRDVSAVDADGLACSAIRSGALAGMIALIARGNCSFQSKVANAQAAGAIAVILFNNQGNQPAVGFTPGTSTQIVSLMIGNAEGLALRAFVQSSTNQASARIGTILQPFAAEANRIASFSSVGPTSDFTIKPDLSAPGVNIYSATQRNFTAGEQFNATGFGISQGTSVSTPMVTGAAAIIRQVFPQLTPAQVKSALVQTASRNLLPAAGGVSGVMAGGNGLLNLQAAVVTPAVVVPSSISLGANPPGTAFSRTFLLTVTNTSNSTDHFSPTIAVAPSGDGAGIRFSPASLDLAAGASGTLAVTFDITAQLRGIVEGQLGISSQSTGGLLLVPFWGNFLQPVVNLSGVVNAASYSAGSTRIAAGGLVSIFGTQLSTTTVSADFLPLPTALAGVRVLINNVEAPLLFVSPAQINAQVPYELASASLGLLQVVVHGVTSAQVPLQMALAAPGIFTLSQSGAGRGAVLHGVTSAPVSDASPARPGEVLSVYASGLGTTSPAATTGAAATGSPLQTTTRPVTASIGGLNAAVSFSGLAPGFTGLYQVNVQVPDTVADGEQSLNITSADVVSNTVTIPVHR